jgi:hypothetical protein
MKITRVNVRWFLCGIIGLLVIAFVICAWMQKTAAERKKIEDLEFTEPIKTGLENKLSSSRTFFQAGLVVFGVLWGLIVAKEVQIKFEKNDLPEAVLAGVSTLVILGSLSCGYLYAEDVTAACASATQVPSAQTNNSNQSSPPTETKYLIPDIFGDRINYLFFLQTWLLVVGVLATGTTFFSIHHLKENP